VKGEGVKRRKVRRLRGEKGEEGEGEREREICTYVKKVVSLPRNSIESLF